MSLINCAGRALISVVVTHLLFGALALAQNRQGVPDLAAPDRPVVLHTTDVARIRLVPVATGLDHVRSGGASSSSSVATDLRSSITLEQK